MYYLRLGEMVKKLVLIVMQILIEAVIHVTRKRQVVGDGEK